MKAAQELYEGVEIEGMGAVGLITYMRTDSLRISDEAPAEAPSLHRASATAASTCRRPSPGVYKSKANAQDGHEAIRPTMPEPDPRQGEGQPDRGPVQALQADLGAVHRQPDGQLPCMDTVAADIDAPASTCSRPPASP